MQGAWSADGNYIVFEYWATDSNTTPETLGRTAQPE